jgi:hypothetical protein
VSHGGLNTFQNNRSAVQIFKSLCNTGPLKASGATSNKKDAALEPGKLIVEPTEWSSLKSILEDLDASGYRLVNVHCEDREDGRESGKHYIVRFIFSATEQSSAEFSRIRKFLRLEFYDICTEALWKTRAYSNPLANGQRGMNIVCDTRRPFIQGDGKLATVWQKDAAGERIGDAPLPLTAGHLLRIAKGDIHLLAA